MKAIPIKSNEELQIIDELVKENSAYHLAFHIGLCNAMTPVDLFSLTYGDLDNINLSPDANEALLRHMDNVKKKIQEEDFIFEGRKGDKPRSLRAFTRYLNDIGHRSGFNGSLSAESLRRTYLYNLYISGITLERLCKKYNFSRKSRLSSYLDLDDKDHIKHFEKRLSGMGVNYGSK